jgi:hypothetical protein
VGVAQQCGHGRIGVDDGAAARVSQQNPVDGAFKEATVAIFRKAQALFGALAFGDLGFERGGLLLQEGDGAQALIQAGLRGEIFGGNDLEVLVRRVKLRSSLLSLTRTPAIEPAVPPAVR